MIIFVGWLTVIVVTLADREELEKGDKQSKGAQPFHNCSVVEGLLICEKLHIQADRKELAICILQTQSNLKTEISPVSGKTGVLVHAVLLRAI